MQDIYPIPGNRGPGGAGQGRAAAAWPSPDILYIFSIACILYTCIYLDILDIFWVDVFGILFAMVTSAQGQLLNVFLGDLFLAYRVQLVCSKVRKF